MVNDETPKERIVNVELLIATFALLASTVASVASIFQTRAMGDQLSASVWPYLTVSTSVDTKPGPRAALRTGTLSFGFKNQGLGPALIRTFAVSVDGRNADKPTWDAVTARLTPHGELRQVGESDFGTGAVIRPGDSATLVEFATPPSGMKKTTLFVDVSRVGMNVCYCSLLQNCWTLTSGADEPSPVHSCGPPTALFTQ